MNNLKIIVLFINNVETISYLFKIKSFTFVFIENENAAYSPKIFSYNKLRGETKEFSIILNYIQT